MSKTYHNYSRWMDGWNKGHSEYLYERDAQEEQAECDSPWDDALKAIEDSDEFTYGQELAFSSMLRSLREAVEK